MTMTKANNGLRGSDRRPSYSPLTSVAMENMEMALRRISTGSLDGDGASSQDESPINLRASRVNPDEVVPRVKVSHSDDEETDGRDAESDSLVFTVDDLNVYKFCRDGNVEGLKKLTSEKESKWRNRINRLDENGLSALHYAARFSRYNVLTLLVGKLKGDVKVKDSDGSTPLHHVARKLQTASTKDIMNVVQYLVKQGADPNAQNQFHWTPLHYAAIRGNETVCRVLLDIPNIKINLKDLNGSTPLHLSLTHNHVNLALMLLEKGATPDVCDDTGLTPLHLAAETGSVQLIDALFAAVPKDKLAKLVNATDYDLNTSLHFAVEKRHIAAVQKLIDAGANVNAQCRPKTVSTSALHMAAVSGDAEIAEVLLNHGANVLAVDKLGCTALHLAAQFNRTAVAVLLLKKGALSQLAIRDSELQFTPLLTAVVSDADGDLVKLFYSFKADVAVVDKNEKSALFLAAEFNRKKLVEVLLQLIRSSGRMSLINQPDKEGNTPLHVAASNGFIDIVKLLLESQALANLKNEEEKTAFHKAAESGRADTCKEIIAVTEGRCLAEEDENSNTSVHLAAAKGHLEVVKLLVSHGADKLSRNYDNLTPLHLAARFGHIDIVRYLLEEKVPPNPTDRAKLTPMHYAAVYNHPEVVELLIQNGGDVSKRDCMGRNVLDIAVDSCHYQVGATILQSPCWRLALMNDVVPASKLNAKDLKKRETVYQILFKLPLVTDMSKLPNYFYNSDNDRRETPLRRIIRKMPDLAKIVFDNCIHKGSGSSKKSGGKNDLNLHVDYNYEFVDDTFSHWNLETGADNEKHQNALYDDNGKLHKDAKRTGSSASYVKANHPLMLMVEYKREALLSHPLITAVVRRKWKLAQVLYMTFLLIFMAFLLLTTTFIVMSDSPYNLTNTTTDPQTTGVPPQTTSFSSQTQSKIYIVYTIWALVAVCACVEVIQLAATGLLSYFTNILNYLDWFCYCSAIAITYHSSGGSISPVMWQLSAFCIFLSWIDLLIILRRVPVVGIYVVMFQETFTTFIRFFAIFFLFILAFAFSFFILLKNQYPFETVFYSIMKTMVMMIGDQDYANTFFARRTSDDPHDQLYSPEATYAIYIVFLMTMTIVVMNLLTGLAVDNVSDMQENAKLKKFGLVIELALEVEQALPMCFMRRSVVGRQRVCVGRAPGTCLGRLVSRIWRLIEGPLATVETSVNKALPEATSTSRLVNETEERLRREIHQNRYDLKRLSTTVDTVSSRVDVMSDKLDRLTSLMENLVAARP